ncbi:hypothetical protein ACTQ49_07255 [Luteococcus sp. Sow4_B9]|uniref:hypothetical protein n=1 Tax=Luteococcus sp. Sow4_B9 TaxID=3438792 RepID=UPI003F9B78D6
MDLFRRPSRGVTEDIAPAAAAGAAAARQAREHEPAPRTPAPTTPVPPAAASRSRSASAGSPSLRQVFGDPSHFDEATTVDEGGPWDPNEKSKGATRRWPWLVGLLVLALAGGGWWLSGRDEEPAVPMAPGTGSASASPSQAAKEEKVPSVLEVPGPGTVESVRKHLQDEGFTCESEGQPGIDSWLCTHYTRNPAMMAYVGGAHGKRVGRVGLNVQDGPGGSNPKALALQEWLASQVVAKDGQQKDLLAAVRKGNEERYAETQQGPVVARGSADGSLVLFVNGWVPDRAAPVYLLPAKPLEQGFKDLGYECGDPGDQVTCTRSEKGFTYTVDYRTEGTEVSYLKVKTASDSGASVVNAAAGEVRAVTGLFQQGKALQKWLDNHEKSTAGATGFQDGMALDWYPGSSQGGAAAVFYLRQSCWTDTVESC